MPATVNEIEVRKKLVSGAKNKANFFYGSAKLRLDSAKREFLEDFDDHIVTKELQEDEVSNTNSVLVEDGSLRAALGIAKGDDPADKLRKYFEKEIRMDERNAVKITEEKNKVFFSWKVFYPSKTQIFEQKEFQLKWTTRTWVEIIEGGLNNLAHFIMAKTAKTSERFTKIGSRSGWGLQKNNVNTGRSFTPHNYISKLIETFRNKFGR